MDINEITERIIGCAIKVHSKLGPGLLESIYQKCLAIELAKTGLRFECQAPVHVVYDGHKVGRGLFIDILVERQVVVEIKAVDRFDPIHTAQVTSYLRLANCAVGLLINFNVLLLPRGIKRIVLGYDGPLPRFPRLPRP
jgi:GxxExxY protein